MNLISKFLNMRLTCWSMTILAGLFISTASAQTRRVIVLPFEIHAEKDRSHLKTEIRDVIKKQLSDQGASFVEPSTDDKSRGAAAIRKMGVQNGADYVIWGSVTWIEQKISVDAKMIESFSDKAPDAFFEEGEGAESLSGMIIKLAREFSLKIFKRERVSEIRITGNKRIEADAIRKVVKTAPGDVYLAKSLSDDLKAVYAMGYFEDIRIESEDSPKGKIIIFTVKEKPTIRQVRFKNNRLFEDKELTEAMNIKTGSVLNIFNIKNNVKRIELLYKEKNYHNVKVTYSVQQLDNNQADVEFVIDEGEKVRIKEIIFSGNHAYSDKELKDLMKTSEKGFWSWLTSSGELNREDLNQDIEKLSAFYQNNGYINSKVGEPQIDFKENWIYITIRVDEGARFTVGRTDVKGDMPEGMSEEDLKKKLKISKETYFSREVVRNDVLMLTDIYSDEGFAYADIAPKIDPDMQKLTVNITYTIQKGKPVYFEKIIISGNTKTRDKVIRRELQVYEQELYSGKKLKRGVRNLYRLDYFEDVRVDTQKGSKDDQMILKIDVKEKPTGTFSFGGGYSSVENVFVTGSVTQRNFLGYGQTLQLKGDLGGQSNRFTLTFTEPWLFDIPLSASLNAYNWNRDYDTYDKKSKGGGVMFGYPVFDYTRAYLSYGYDVADITNITEDASKLVREMEGTNVTSSVSASLRYDSRDRFFNPTEGGDHSISVQYAGLGGDIGFTKYIGELGQYIPLFWGTVGFLHGRAGYVSQNPDKKLPDYERFYLGGINTLRGFGWRDISSYDEYGDKIGGDKFVQFNVEYLIPLIKKAGLMGVLFYDTGNVYGTGEKMDFGELRQSAGFGFRWYSPMGPIRIEHGYILDPKDGESRSGKWEFTIGY